MEITGDLSAVGGSGAIAGGGGGGLGRVRISGENTRGGDCVLDGTFSPPLSDGCADEDANGFAYVARWPR
jgi:hypothetical protein